MIIISKSETLFPEFTPNNQNQPIAVGGNLQPDFILSAYKKGVFPWYNPGEPILWWFTDPRCILVPRKLKISKSMKQVLRQNEFEFTINKNFDAVIQHCMQIKRKDQMGSWIQTDIISAYRVLHKQGFVESAEAWHKGELVGGLYGVKIGKVFFGESMFSQKTNASKFAFIKYTQVLMQEGIQLIDCQIETAHLLSLGAETIPALKFIAQLKQLIQ